MNSAHTNYDTILLIARYICKIFLFHLLHFYIVCLCFAKTLQASNKSILPVKKNPRFEYFKFVIRLNWYFCIYLLKFTNSPHTYDEHILRPEWISFPHIYWPPLFLLEGLMHEDQWIAPTADLWHTVLALPSYSKTTVPSLV